MYEYTDEHKNKYYRKILTMEDIIQGIPSHSAPMLMDKFTKYFNIHFKINNTHDCRNGMRRYYGTMSKKDIFSSCLKPYFIWLAGLKDDELDLVFANSYVYDIEHIIDIFNYNSLKNDYIPYDLNHSFHNLYSLKISNNRINDLINKFNGRFDINVLGINFEGLIENGNVKYFIVTNIENILIFNIAIKFEDIKDILNTVEKEVTNEKGILTIGSIKYVVNELLLKLIFNKNKE